MAAVNAHLAALHGSYLFSEIGRRVASFSQENPGVRLLSLGIGDVTRPIAPAVIGALCAAASEMAREDTFRGYGPTAGYPFLIDAIREVEYAPLGIQLASEEIFVSDGAKSDMANIQELFSSDARVAVCDPVYPVYVDSNLMAGRKVVMLNCRAEQGFLPSLPEESVDVIYLCSPNNPTGAVCTKELLERFVAYARERDALLLYDAAYRAYIGTPGVPHSIFEIDGAKEVAVECCSFSKSAGFTGLRCAYAVIPKENRWGLGALWARRAATKFNGVAYPIQRAAEAALLPEGRAQSEENIRYYMENARILEKALKNAGYTVYGGTDAPYLFVRCPGRLSSWAWFDALLFGEHIVSTPGEGFGACGAGFVRFSSFAAREDIEEAARRLGG